MSMTYICIINKYWQLAENEERKKNFYNTTQQIKQTTTFKVFLELLIINKSH